jgi:hypothetical protein
MQKIEKLEKTDNQKIPKKFALFLAGSGTCPRPSTPQLGIDQTAFLQLNQKYRFRYN